MAVLVVLGSALTLAPKLFIGVSVRRPPIQAIVDAPTAVLEAGGFQVVHIASQEGERGYLLALRDGCLVRVQAVTEQGWDAAYVETLSAGASLWYVFDGAIYEKTQPRVLTTFRYFKDLFVSYVGMNSSYTPTYAVFGPTSCGIEALDWKRLPKIPFQRNTFYDFIDTAAN